MNPKDNQANIKNPNKGTTGTNRQYDQVQGNRGAQLNPNRKGSHTDEMSRRINRLLIADLTVAVELDPTLDYLLDEDFGE